eukprot:747175-Hanusia_phi.AAC.8
MAQVKNGDVSRDVAPFCCLLPVLRAWDSLIFVLAPPSLVPEETWMVGLGFRVGMFRGGREKEREEARGEGGGRGEEQGERFVVRAVGQSFWQGAGHYRPQGTTLEVSGVGVVQEFGLPGIPCREVYQTPPAPLSPSPSPLPPLLSFSPSLLSYSPSLRPFPLPLSSPLLLSSPALSSWRGFYLSTAHSFLSLVLSVCLCAYWCFKHPSSFAFHLSPPCLISLIKIEPVTSFMESHPSPLSHPAPCDHQRDRKKSIMS